MVLRRTAGLSVASIVRVGPWVEENLRPEFRELVRWAVPAQVRTGRWVFLERAHDRWEACLEVKGPAVASGRIRLKTLPASWAAVVAFDPDQVSSRIVYHGLNGWTRALRKAGKITRVTGIREVYGGDPWKKTAAWSSCEVQFLVAR